MLADRLLPLTEFDYHRHLAQVAGDALVLISSTDCGTCRQAEALLPRSAPPGTALFRVDARECLALVRAFDVFHLPALLLYHDGRYHARLDCRLTPDALRHAMATALAAPAEEEP